MGDFSHALSKVHPDWLNLQDFDYALKILGRVAENGVEFAPGIAEVFRVYSTPPSSVRVVIVGQDPYPTRGDANGLAFSVDRAVNLPKSLRNIFKELSSDLQEPLREDGDLSDWQSEGVFLLNRTLTVPLSQSNGHSSIGWQDFTLNSLEVLGNYGAVALLLGKSAAECAPIFKETVITTHPSPLSAYRGFFGSKPFSTINNLLDQPINWSGKLK